MVAQGPSPVRTLVLASTFYTVALESPVNQALAAAGHALSVVCVPYNQLHSFLLDPQSTIPANTPAKVTLLLRSADLIRTELVSSAESANPGDSLLRAFRDRTTQFLDVLSRMSRLSLTLLICPSNCGVFDIKSLGTAVRITEYKIAAELRGQQRHLVLSWQEFERSGMPEKMFNPSADRLGHVPFTPQGLNTLARFLSAQIERMPTTTVGEPSQIERMPTTTVGEPSNVATADLRRFLAGLNVKVRAERLTKEDENAALNLVRHTTHFINWPTRKWEEGGISELAANAVLGEAWIVRVRDRLGDYGISGALTFGVEDGVMCVGLLFLTCPVLGRQVEYAFMAWVADLAEQRGATEIDIPFAPGRDNGNLQTMVESWGRAAHEIHNSSDTSERRFRLSVAGLSQRIAQEAPDAASLRAILSGLRSEPIQIAI